MSSRCRHRMSLMTVSECMEVNRISSEEMKYFKKRAYFKKILESKRKSGIKDVDLSLINFSNKVQAEIKSFLKNKRK